MMKHVVVAIPLAFFASCAAAQFTSTTNRATWTAQVGADNVSTWNFHPAVLNQATEGVGRPAPNTELGSVLTFADQLPPFTLRAMQPGAQLVYKDALFSGTLPEFLGIGKTDIHEDDDLEIDVSAGCVRAVGFVLFNNTTAAGEQVRVYGEGDVLLGTVASIASSNPFIGVAVASGRITRIEIDEDAIGRRHRHLRSASGRLRGPRVAAHLDDDRGPPDAVAAIRAGGLDRRRDVGPDARGAPRDGRGHRAAWRRRTIWPRR
jgi:hypothetical protein